MMMMRRAASCASPRRTESRLSGPVIYAILEGMMIQLRPVIVTMILTALLVANIGWAIARVADFDRFNASVVSVSATQHLHGPPSAQAVVLEDVSVQSSDGVPSEEATYISENIDQHGTPSDHHDGARKSCCEMNCHMATVALGQAFVERPSFRGVQTDVILADCKQASAARLERPPRRYVV